VFFFPVDGRFRAAALTVVVVSVWTVDLCRAGGVKRGIARHLRRASEHSLSLCLGVFSFVPPLAEDFVGPVMCKNLVALLRDPPVRFFVLLWWPQALRAGYILGHPI